jgi:transposase
MSSKMSAYGTQPSRTGTADAPKKKKKKKKKMLNEAQSQRLNDLQARTYMDTLLMKHIGQSAQREEYETKITHEKLPEAVEKYKTSLQQVNGNAELIDAFAETKKWLDNESWKDECIQVRWMIAWHARSMHFGVSSLVFFSTTHRRSRYPPIVPLSKWKERKYREELYGEKETFDPNTYDDEDEDEDEDD